MKTTNNYEAPVAEMIEMSMPVVLDGSNYGGGGGTTPIVPDPGTVPPIPMP